MQAKVHEYLKNCNNPVMLVKHYNEVPSKFKKFPMLVQEKFDGVFCLVVVADGYAEFYTRTGKLMYLEIHPHTGIYTMLRDGVYIGELCCSALTLEELSGMVNPNRVERWPLDKSMRFETYASVYFHDFITLDELLKGISKRPYVTRYEELCTRVSVQNTIKTTAVNTEEELLEFADKTIKQHKEGICIKLYEASWVAGHKGYRSMKIVRDLHVDLRCHYVQYGTGKLKDVIAKLGFSYKGKEFAAGTGAGWTFEKLRELTEQFKENPDSVVGKIWHVSALQESSKGVLRLPKFNEMRVDKENSD